MNPYFDTSHLAGALLLVPVLAWGVMEASHFGNGREGATKVGGARRFAAWPFLIAASAVLYLAPHLVSAAAIRPGAVAFAIGLVILLTGLVLRGWSILTLGEYFTATVKVSADQPVITAGPYQVLRHPSYTGLLLVMTGIGLASANWAGAARNDRSHAGRDPLAHPRGGARAADHARRPLPCLRRATQAPGPARLVITIP